MKKILALILMAAMALGATASAAGLDFGVILPTREETRWLGDEAKFQAAIEEGGYDALILFSQKDSATEKANVETLISRGAKVIVLWRVRRGGGRGGGGDGGGGRHSGHRLRSHHHRDGQVELLYDL